MLLRLAKALMCANDVEAALCAVAHHLAYLRPDSVLLIGNLDGGDSCFYLDLLRGSACLEPEHQLCSSVRKLASDGVMDLPWKAYTAGHGCHVVAPFSTDAQDGCIAFGWKAPPLPAVRRHALKLLPHIAELAGVRLDNLLGQFHRDREVHEQAQVFAANQTRHIEELRVSEHEKVAARELAAQDELTGLQNRRGFLAKSEQCLLIAQRLELACAVIFADVDGLKRINDLHGHTSGDDLIRDAANIFNSAFRHADVVARVGGDEFAAFTFDNATPRAIIERIKAKIAAYNLAGKMDFPMSLSIGVVNCDPRSAETLSEYLARADEEMYRQKRGRAHAIL